MKSFLKLSLVQADLKWENVQANLDHFQELLKQISSTDVIVLPEMFTTGFTMNVELAEDMNGHSMNWMAAMAAEKNAVVTGSVIIKDQGCVYNRLIWMRPDGTYQHYDKRHLFRMAKEDAYYNAGHNKLIVEVSGWKVCPLVCYDMRFPVWSRNRFDAEGKAEYDVLLYVANWPERRRIPWNKLLPARGIENLSYVAGVNRMGEDGNGIPYSGDSAAYDYTGVRLTNMESGKEVIETISLDRDKLKEFRKHFPAYLDADEFDIRHL
jgi:omega-amidase